MCGGVEKEITDVAIAVGELELVGGLPFDILFSGELDLVALGFVIHEWAIKIGFLENVAQIGRRHGLDGRVGREWIVGPTCGLAVVGADDDTAVEIEFHVHFEGAGAFDDEGALRTRAEGDGAGDALGLNGFDLVQATAGDEILGEDFVGGLRRRGKSIKNREKEKREFAHGGFRVCGVAGTQHRKNVRCRIRKGQYAAPQRPAGLLFPAFWALPGRVGAAGIGGRILQAAPALD